MTTKGLKPALLCHEKRLLKTLANFLHSDKKKGKTTDSLRAKYFTADLFYGEQLNFPFTWLTEFFYENIAMQIDWLICRTKNDADIWCYICRGG